MSFFAQTGELLSKQEWLRTFEPGYFLNGPTFGLRRLNQSSPFVEARIEELLANNDGLSEENLKLVMGWKIGEIRHRPSEDQQAIIHLPLWDQQLTEHRYGRNYAQSIRRIAATMPRFHQLPSRGHSQVVFDWHRQFTGFGPTFMLTILYFLTHGREPIYDKYAHKAALAYDQKVRPGGHVRHYQPVQSWSDYERFKRLLMPIASACDMRATGAMLVPRSVDRALWVYGHLFE
jgi:hypothetical protein